MFGQKGMWRYRCSIKADPSKSPRKRLERRKRPKKSPLSPEGKCYIANRGMFDPQARSPRPGLFGAIIAVILACAVNAANAVTETPDPPVTPSVENRTAPETDGSCSRLPGFSELRVPERRTSGKKLLVPVNDRQGNALLYEETLRCAQDKPLGVVISLSKQRLWLLVGGEIGIDSPIASGRREGWTPKGQFRILEKDLNHRSNKYGDLVDERGVVVRKNVSCGAKGGIFRGAPMKYFMRLTQEGVGMHAGYLPGYPASHGCIRLPRDVAERIYRMAPLGTPVLVTD